MFSVQKKYSPITSLLPSYFLRRTAIFIVVWVSISSFKFPSSPKACVCISSYSPPFYLLKNSNRKHTTAPNYLITQAFEIFNTLLTHCTIPVCVNSCIFLERQTWNCFDNLSSKDKHIFSAKILFRSNILEKSFI